ncbi:MAG: PorT family protein [Bacteroidota bacterium]|nr:MAG: PorT family protein [Bacteroidota bacterium]QQS51040.1 MAG: PorT family protein [Bacteroidota bacterium]
MKQRFVLILALTLIGKLSYSQIIDRYGINVGTSYSTQIWDYKLVNVDSDNEYKFGLQAFLQAEKDFGKLLALRTEFGYIQKGFKNNLTLTSAEGTFIGTNNDNVILHDLALNLGLKIKLLKTDFSPYFLAGLRGDYMISYKDVEIEEPGSGLKFNMYESTIEDFNKFNIGGLIGLGIDIKDLIYFELEYNPNFTKNLDNAGLSIKDICWGAKIGLNINKLTE